MSACAIEARRQNLRLLCAGPEVSALAQHENPQTEAIGGLGGASKTSYRLKNDDERIILVISNKSAGIAIDDAFKKSHAESVLLEVCVANLVYGYILGRNIESVVHTSDKNDTTGTIHATSVTQMQDDTVFPLDDIITEATKLIPVITILKVDIPLEYDTPPHKRAKIVPRRLPNTLNIQTFRFRDGEFFDTIEPILENAHQRNLVENADQRNQALKKYLACIVKLQRMYAIASMDTKFQNVMVDGDTYCPIDFDRGIIVLRQQDEKWHIVKTEELKDMDDNADVMCRQLCTIPASGPFDKFQGYVFHHSAQDHGFGPDASVDKQFMTNFDTVDANAMQQPMLKNVGLGRLDANKLQVAVTTINDKTTSKAEIAKVVMLNCLRCDLLNALCVCQRIGLPHDTQWDAVIKATSLADYYAAICAVYKAHLAYQAHRNESAVWGRMSSGGGWQ